MKRKRDATRTRDTLTALSLIFLGKINSSPRTLTLFLLFVFPPPRTDLYTNEKENRKNEEISLTCVYQPARHTNELLRVDDSLRKLFGMKNCLQKIFSK
jgi:hypothetical protein